MIRKDIAKILKEQNLKLKEEFYKLKEKLKMCLEILQTKKNNNNSMTMNKNNLHSENLNITEEYKNSKYKDRFGMASNINKITMLEDKERAKRELLKELLKEEQALIDERLENSLYDETINQLEKELTDKKAELNKKQDLLKYKEKWIRLQDNKLAKLKRKCQKVENLIVKHKTNKEFNSKEEVEEIKMKLNVAEKDYRKNNLKHNTLLNKDRNHIKNLRLELARTSLIETQKLKESRMNHLRMNILKSQVKQKLHAELINNKKTTISPKLIAKINNFKNEIRTEENNNKRNKANVIEQFMQTEPNDEELK